MPIYAGVMSGTSLDGTDVAFVDIALLNADPEHPQFHIQTLATHFVPYTDDLRKHIATVRSGGLISIAHVSSLHYELAHIYADAIEACAIKSGIAVQTLERVGMHGQTVWHMPPSNHEKISSTLQLGQPAVLAERLGIDIVSDFRAADIAAGGEGAPLVPFADYVMLASPIETRVILNIGGIANITYLEAGGKLRNVIAFDTGPGNMVIDGIMAALTEAHCDQGGAIALSGEADDDLVLELVSYPFFMSSPPKSTGAERFGSHYVTKFLEITEHLSLPDKIATATNLTVQSIANALRYLLPTMPTRVIVGGGGTHNQALMQGLAKALPDVTLESHEAHGIPSDFKEAIAFALLAATHQLGIPANIHHVTGARGQRVLGSVTLGYNR